MTCILEKGKKCQTNVSIDRIIPGGSYSISNIQLVCNAMNVARNTMSVDELVHWCRLVVEKADAVKKRNATIQSWEASLGV
jgi:hypothetical protein